MKLEIVVSFFTNLSLEIVLICWHKRIDGFSNSCSKKSSFGYIFLPFFNEVIGIIVKISKIFSYSFDIIKTGLVPFCSLPMVGFKSAR